MIVRSNRPTHHFTIVDNAIVNDETLTYRARGILVYLLSKPDGWYTSAQRLANQYTEGRDAINTSLKELEDKGYMQLVKRQNDLGQWESHWLVFDNPVQKAVDKLRTIREKGKKPSPEKPSSDNQGLYKELTTKDLISSTPQVCGHCMGGGVEYRDGEIHVCPECKGDGIARG